MRDIDRAYKGKDLVAKVKELLDFYEVLLYGIDEEEKPFEEKIFDKDFNGLVSYIDFVVMNSEGKAIGIGLEKIQELEGQVREEMYWLREYQLGSSDVHHRRAYYEGKNSTWNAQDVEEAISPSCNVSEAETK